MQEKGPHEIEYSSDYGKFYNSCGYWKSEVTMSESFKEKLPY